MTERSSTGIVLLERAVMKLMLDGDDPVLAKLRVQYRQSSVAGREYTGVGFFTDFSVSSDEHRLSGKQRFQIHDIHGEIEGLAYGAGFILFVEHGKLAMLEGVSYENEWPDALGEFQVEYDGGGERDLTEVRKAWADP